MTQGFDKDYWESHWQQADGHGAGREIVPNPHLARETSSLVPGTALDAGCGEGAEAIWLATAGWQVAAADISAEALSRASERATRVGAPPDRVQWVEADLGAWQPGTRFDLVTTHYAHPAMPQLAFYERISDWVAPGGSLLIVGHLHTPESAEHAQQHGQQGHEHDPPEEASVTAEGITARLDATQWDVVTAEEHTRTLTDRAGRAVQLHDVVVRATRRPELRRQRRPHTRRRHSKQARALVGRTRTFENLDWKERLILRVGPGTQRTGRRFDIERTGAVTQPLPMSAPATGLGPAR